MIQFMNISVKIALLLFSSACLLKAETPEFFESDDVISFRLEAPIVSLKNQRGDDPEWLQAKVYFQEAEGAEAILNVKIKARGHFRRKRVNCSFPPYWINFRKSEVKGTLFEGLDKVKVVAHCQNYPGSYRPYLHREYLAYKTYNVLTDRSLRVRLANVHYFDTDRERDLSSYAAFFIEHVESFEDRLNAKRVRDPYVLPSRYNQSELCRAEMFQFFIGNTDFSFLAGEPGEADCCHNGMAFELKGNKEGLIPVPYDFDLSGLVNPPYAAVDPHYPITSVKTRYYRGMGVEKEILEDTMNLYLRKKGEIYDLWENSGFLPAKFHAKARKYIDGFYKILEDKWKIKQLIIGELRTIEVVEKVIQKYIDEERKRR